MKTIALIPAAGMGRRMQAGINKQYLHLGGRPILAHTLALFDGHPRVDRIIVISPAEEIDFCRTEVVERFGFAKVRAVVAGGAERQDSVRNGLQAASAGADDIVLVHDGVRPLLPPALIDAAIDTAGRDGACIVGVPVKDTVKNVENGTVVATPDRRRLWLAQTPQAFRFALLDEAYRRAASEGYAGTDDASLVERLGHPVAMVEGSYRNIKITTPEDLILARAFLDERTA
ncbi:MAG: 2-C-methyl-D-erythritol 4-phosphate cytidylyltransferase [Desulfuromonadales bacterium]|nr:2-C-methyl-D-erythritol 4-phosphate cytidylyltransferase [Desulfuromonadales bacterium]NIR33022.1 2-C-methyl-D-erythritol 4-phosphate cytidylyltransferase [Desulfuromonadales bacterium]NIS39265.1 2-C-methyl-D-erythritol 4-phosphate cytidylyltransferase [Desulfuromonadales bacterium]